MKNVRRICLQAVYNIAEGNEEFSCTAIGRIERKINSHCFPSTYDISQHLHIAPAVTYGPIEEFYREVFSYRLKTTVFRKNSKNEHLYANDSDLLLYAVEKVTNFDANKAKELRILMLSLFAVAWKDFKRGYK